VILWNARSFLTFATSRSSIQAPAARIARMLAADREERYM
jgi:hypothetical protein